MAVDPDPPHGLRPVPPALITFTTFLLRRMPCRACHFGARRPPAALRLAAPARAHPALAGARALLGARGLACRRRACCFGPPGARRPPHAAARATPFRGSASGRDARARAASQKRVLNTQPTPCCGVPGSSGPGTGAKIGLLPAKQKHPATAAPAPPCTRARRRPPVNDPRPAASGRRPLLGAYCLKRLTPQTGAALSLADLIN